MHQDLPFYHYIDSQEQVTALSKRMETAGLIALDTEADSLHHYYAKVCLIQITFAEENYIVDPLAKLDLTEFLQRLAEKPLLLHGADYDLRMLRASFRFWPQGEVFDTMVAAQLLGLPQISLDALVEEYFDVHLADLGKKTNWSQRPLTPEQLQYACEDTYYLERLAEKLRAKLVEKNRSAWLKESCRRVVESSRIDKPRDPEKAWRITGIRNLNRRQMAYLRELWHWRELEAQRADLPPFKILGNHKLLELVNWASAHPDASLETGPKLPKNYTARRIRELSQAILKAQNTPPARWPSLILPQPPAPTYPNCKQLIQELMAVGTALAEKLEIPLSVLATRAAVTAVAHQQPLTLEDAIEKTPLMRWQAELLFPAFQEVLIQSRQNPREESPSC